MNQVLVIDDEPRIASALGRGLSGSGFPTTIAPDGAAARAWLLTTRFALVILDLRLPEADGIEVLRELRRDDPWTPVIVLTARDTVQDKVRCFEAGADDYVTKPFRFEELLARVRARVRGAAADPTALTVGRARLDLYGRRLVIDERSVPLTERELSLAQIFFLNVGHVLSRQQLFAQVWGSGDEARSDVVDAHVMSLREKLGTHRITALRGMGYRLEPDRDEARSPTRLLARAAR
jgi:DNA-binding response OmpR family regulator